MARQHIQRIAAGDDMLTASGPWWAPLTETDGSTSAVVCCPDCGTRQALTDHTIAPNGVVTPSLLCASSGCSFHVMATLEDWPP